ncbi:hypothetical protein ebA739 [Aromatoleum aromaticum EbN1]|uniref:Uncharacterized protein n=1 Tax=Aromatoleum aromaticum (strain DSM 19018 / LMG 30748 / EbN1) TaxID=76114 RepID=Q5P863_AROAE|nr:hypothetical protein ebA739 [Aromatoleum aromaticum EbN1]
MTPPPSLSPPKETSFIDTSRGPEELSFQCGIWLDVPT